MRSTDDLIRAPPCRRWPPYRPPTARDRVVAGGTAEVALGSPTSYLLLGATALLALLVTVLLSARFKLARRGARGGGGMGTALSMGMVVLVLGVLNVFQFAAGPAASPAAAMTVVNAGPPGEDVKARAERNERKRLSSSPLPNAGDQELVDRFANLFYHGHDTWMDRTWLGVPTYQNPNDVWIHQEIIAALKPDYIIEAGTAKGGSALLWAMIQREVNPAGKVITMDIADPSELATSQPLWSERVEFIKGSSTDPATVARLAESVRDRQVLVILDSDHSKVHVAAELKAYAPMVPVGSYVIVQDTNVNGHPVAPDHGPGPMEAVEEFLAADDRFVADRSREALMFTMHPKGYLKRIK